MQVRPGKFEIEGSPLFEGFTAGQTWNGWACPYFTLDNAKKVMAEFGGEEIPADQPFKKDADQWYYDSKKDAFRVNCDQYNDPYEMPGEDVEHNGQTIRVYAIGNGCWVWDEDKTGLKRMLVMVTMTPGAVDPSFKEPYPGWPAPAPLTVPVRDIMVFTIDQYEHAQENLPTFAGRRKAGYTLTVLADNLTNEEIEKLSDSIDSMEG